MHAGADNAMPYRADYHAAREMLRARFAADGRAADYLAGHAAAMDGLIRALATRCGVDATQICCLAVGGYGRQELFPHSDIDLLFLYAYDAAAAEGQVQALLYGLWDMGLKIGYAVRRYDETVPLARADHTIAASLLDRRYLFGSRVLYDELERRITRELIGHAPADFIKAKLGEREARHLRHGDSRFLLEPNVRENKGGLRDLHCLHWLCAYVYGVRDVGELSGLGLLSPEHHRDYRRTQHFLWRVRIHLHLLAGRADDRLTFDRQCRIAEALGYRGRGPNEPVERFMKRYYLAAKQVGDLTRLLCALLEEAHQPRERRRCLAGFTLRGRRLDFAHSQQPSHDPLALLKIFQIAQRHQLTLHPQALQQVTRHRAQVRALRDDPRANALFLEMLLSPHAPDAALAALNEAGVLRRFIPEFARILGQMQFDRYHIYTVDEHIIRAIGILHAIERGMLVDELPLASFIVHRIASRRALYVALLCHDIAKGTGGAHAQKGALIAHRLAQRFGLGPAEAEMAAWAVREQSLMSDIAFGRDLDDARTIADFVARVQSPERLHVLLLLTVCDIRAVGPNIWNGWKGALLRELYARAEEAMGVRPPHPQRLAEAAFAPLAATRFACAWSIDRFRSITRLRLCLAQHPALLAHIAGSLATIDASIVAARLFALENGKAVALLDIQNRRAQAFDDTARLEKMQQILQASLAGTFDLPAAVAEQQAAYPCRSQCLPELFIDNHGSDDHTLIEVGGPDRLGFLYDVASALSALGLTVSSAQIATYGDKAVDVFYVRDAAGSKILDEARLAQIRDMVLARVTVKW